MSDVPEMILDSIKVAMAAIKDIAMADCLKRIEDSQRKLILEEAEGNRKKERQILDDILRLDIEIIELEDLFSKKKTGLDREAIKSIESILNGLKGRKQDLIKEKDRINSCTK